MASQEEQRDAGVIRERILGTSTPGSISSSFNICTPYRYQPGDDKNKVNEEEGGPRRTADSDVLALHLFHAGCLARWFRSHTTCLTCRFDIDPKSFTLLMPPPTKRGGPRERARE